MTETKQTIKCEWNNCEEEASKKIPRDDSIVDVCRHHYELFYKNLMLLGNDLLNEQGR